MKKGAIVSLYIYVTANSLRKYSWVFDWSIMKFIPKEANQRQCLLPAHF